MVAVMNEDEISKGMENAIWSQIDAGDWIIAGSVLEGNFDNIG